MVSRSFKVMKSILRFLMFLLFCADAEAQSPQKPMRLFLLLGQSNMAGRGSVPSNEPALNSRIYMMNREMNWIQAKDPVHFDKPIAGVGLCSEFARVLVKKDTNITVGLIPCAMGGSSLDEWKPGSKLYTQAVERAREAMKSGELAGILWHQGEADSAPDKVATYGERFSAMIGQLRADLGASATPVVVGELGRFREANHAFNEALPKVVSRVPNCALATAENLTDKGDKLHFNTQSLHLFGQRYTAVFLALEAKKKLPTR